MIGAGRDYRLLSAASILTIAVPLFLTLAGCDRKEEAAPDIRPVRTVTVEPGTSAVTNQLTGEIRARYESDLGFRTDGKIIDRPVDVGSVVKKGDVLAKLDPQPRQQDLLAAKAAAVSAKATLVKEQSNETRQAQLVKDGYATRAAYDDAVASLKAAQSQVESTSAQLQQAQDNLGYTKLLADADGVITSVSGNIGQVVSTGQTIVRLAQPGEREAAFNIPEAILASARTAPPVTVSLASNPSIKIVGQVRYVSPQADQTTRTYEGRVTLPDAPPEMRLGATVVGTASLLRSESLVELPGSALFEHDGKPAVWLVDAKALTVSLKPITVSRYTGDRIVVGDGLSKGDVVVTAGVQKLIPGQKVRLLGPAPQ